MKCAEASLKLIILFLLALPIHIYGSGIIKENGRGYLLYTDTKTGIIYELYYTSMWNVPRLYFECRAVGFDENYVSSSVVIPGKITLHLPIYGDEYEDIVMDVAGISGTYGDTKCSFKSSKVTSITIENSTKPLESEYFKDREGNKLKYLTGAIDCENLIELKLPMNINYLHSFSVKSGKLKLQLPDNIVGIENCLFDCEEVEFPATTTYYSWTTIGGDNLKSVTFLGNMGKTTYFGNITIQNETAKSFAVPDGIERLSEAATVNGVICPKFYFPALESITIPKSVKAGYSGSYLSHGYASQSFLSKYCPNLKEVRFNDDVTSIPDYLFGCCLNLKTIIFPDKLEHIGDGAFVGCLSLETLKIPKSVKSIGVGAFMECSSLKDIYVYWDTPVEGDYRSDWWSNPERETSVFANIPYAGERLTVNGIRFPQDSAPDIYETATLHLESDPNKPMGDIGGPSLYRYKRTNPWKYFRHIKHAGGTTWNFDITVTAKGDGKVVYDYWSSGSNGNDTVVETYEVKDGTRSFNISTGWVPMEDEFTIIVDEGATLESVLVNGEEKVDQVEINSSNNTGILSLKNISGSTTIEVKFSGSGTGPGIGNDIITFADKEVKEISVKNWDTNGDGELSEAEAAAVTDLGMAFKGNGEISSFDELEYFTGLTSIPNNTFWGCTKLASIVIPANVTDLGTYHPFFLCSALRKVRVAEGNSKYDSRNDCNGIIETAENMLVYGTPGMTIPPTVTSIGNAAFANNPMTSITIPNSIKTIGAQAFVSCENLTSIVIPASVTNMYIDSFLGCSSLTSISVETGNKAFDSRDNCNAIIYTSTNTLITGCKTTVIPTSVTQIGDAAFAMQKSLASIELPENITSIGKNAFWQCTSLAKVRIPSTVTSIGEFAFEDCYSLTEVHSDISIPFAINDNVFTTYSTTTLYVPAGKKNLYETTAGWKNFLKIEEMRVGDVITVTAKNYTRQYGEANPTFEFDVKGGVALGNASVSCEATATSPVGTYPIVISRGDIANSEVTLENGTLTITKAPLTITAKSYTRKQGEENPKFEVEYSGFKNNETESVLTKKPTVTTKATAGSEPGEYDIVVTGAEAQNYELHYVNGKLTVEKRPIINEGGAVYEITEPNDGREAGVAFEDGVVENGEYEIPSAVSHEGKNYTVTGIGAGAFNDNTALIQITIPETVIYIDCGAFTGCRNLAVIIVYAEHPISFRLALTRAGDYGVFEGVDKEKCVLYVPDGSVNAYKAAEGWSEFKQIQPITALGINGLCQDGRTFDVYNLQGRKVLNDANNLDGLPRGVYIVNGRKIVK